MADQDARAYLARFGYRSAEAFQAEAGLVPDGVIGPRTQRAMQAPRCGVTDEMQRASAGSGARDPGRDYQRDPIIYGFAGWVLDETIQRREFARACQGWSAVAGIRLREQMAGERAELVVDVRTRRNDRNLDGPGRTLAYAYLGGKLMIFDGDENWTSEPGGAGIIFRNVACHELGHILNFGHSQIRSALMAAYYSSAVADPVSPDDVERARAVYGRPFPPPTTTTQPPGGGGQPGGWTGQLRFRNGRLDGVE